MHNLYTIIKSILPLKIKLLAKEEPSVTNTDRNTFYIFTSTFIVKKKKSALSGFKGMGMKIRTYLSILILCECAKFTFRLSILMYFLPYFMFKYQCNSV